MTHKRPSAVSLPSGRGVSASGRPRAGAGSGLGSSPLDPHRIYDCEGGGSSPNPSESRDGPEGAGKSSPQPRKDLLPWRRYHRDYLRGLGFNLAELAADAHTVERQRSMRWVEGLKTRTNTDRAQRLANCGALHVGKYRNGMWGVDHAYCKDRACPWCMKARQGELAKAARARLEAATEDGLGVDFVTLTGVKLPDEGAAEAVGRRLATWRRLNTLACSHGRMLRELYQGGMRSLEVVFSAAGAVRRDGSRVLEDGWHAHLHCLLERAPFSAEALGRVWLALAKQRTELRRRWEKERNLVVWGGGSMLPHIDAKLAAVDELLELVFSGEQAWPELARECLLWAWLDENPESSRWAQDVQAADTEKAGQVCKYVTKPFELRDDARGREVFLALDRRKVVNGFGTWSRWIAEAQEDKEESPGVLPFERARTRFSTVLEAARLGAERVVVDMGPYEVTVDPARVVSHVASAPMTRHARLRAMAHQEEPAWKDRDKAMWVAEQWMRARIDAEKYLEKKRIPWAPSCPPP